MCILVQLASLVTRRAWLVFITVRPLEPSMQSRRGWKISCITQAPHVCSADRGRDTTTCGSLSLSCLATPIELAAFVQVPAYGTYLLWKHVLQPYLNQPKEKVTLLACLIARSMQARAQSLPRGSQLTATGTSGVWQHGHLF